MNKMQAFFKRNGATVLTCVGGAGVVATAVLTAKATPKAIRLLEEAEMEKLDELTVMEKIKIAGPVYIPAAVMGVGTIACVFGANVLNKRQQASLAAAYAFLDTSYKEYKKKVEDLYGEGSNKEIIEEIAKDHYEEDELELSNEDDTRLFYDSFSMRYFESTAEKVLRAEYEFNKRLASNGGAFLNEFYELLDIPRVDYANNMGWSQGVLSSMYWDYWLDFDHDEVTMDDGLECTIITFRHEPVIDFDYY